LRRSLAEYRQGHRQCVRERTNDPLGELDTHRGENLC